MKRRASPPVSADRARAMLRYDPQTGALTWRADIFVGRKRKVLAHARGSTAGMVHPTRGYALVGLDGRLYRAHRLIWLIVTGAWPAALVDHANGDRADNRWCNLRLADHGQSARNRRAPLNNTSGAKGVNFNRRRGLWRARIMASGRRHELGHFQTLEEAAAAYASAAARFHGEFANTGVAA